MKMIIQLHTLMQVRHRIKWSNYYNFHEKRKKTLGEGGSGPNNIIECQ